MFEYTVCIKLHYYKYCVTHLTIIVLPYFDETAETPTTYSVESVRF